MCEFRQKVLSCIREKVQVLLTCAPLATVVYLYYNVIVHERLQTGTISRLHVLYLCLLPWLVCGAARVKECEEAFQLLA